MQLRLALAFDREGVSHILGTERILEHSVIIRSEAKYDE
jgi:hypothetical protein